MNLSRPLKFYVGSSFDRKEETNEIQRKIRERGHIITGDWTLHRNIYPYDQHLETATEYATEDTQATLDSDVLVILSSEGGTGNHAELGMGIASNRLIGKPLVYILGDRLSRQVFYYHPIVRRRGDIYLVMDEAERELLKTE